jgi:hypothetical protein
MDNLLKTVDAAEDFQITMNLRVACLQVGQHRIERLQQAWVGQKTGEVIWRPVEIHYVRLPEELI